ncbi:MAG: alpha-amylase, partial [Verrucomicrobiota bacterium]
ELSTELLQTTSNLLLQLPQQLPHLDPTSRTLALSLLENPSPLLLKIHSLSSHPIATTKFRTHGDFHLGQVLDTGNQFVIIDFEGEPQRSITQRRRKQSPVRDLAGLCRSLDYAAQSVLQDFPASHLLLPPIVNRWRDLASHAFLQGWSQTVAPAPFAPSPDDLAWLLHSFLLEKALYEVSYELHHRPAWLPIPLNGLLQLLSTPT